jgi:hypothetical protein
MMLTAWPVRDRPGTETGRKRHRAWPRPTPAPCSATAVASVAWIAGRRWRAVPSGGTVIGELHGWQFRVAVIAAGLRISASALTTAARLLEQHCLPSLTGVSSPGSKD